MEEGKIFHENINQTRSKIETRKNYRDWNNAAFMVRERDHNKNSTHSSCKKDLREDHQQTHVDGDSSSNAQASTTQEQISQLISLLQHSNLMPHNPSPNHTSSSNQISIHNVHKPYDTSVVPQNWEYFNDHSLPSQNLNPIDPIPSHSPNPIFITPPNSTNQNVPRVTEDSSSTHIDSPFE
ncbi:unnamed protein product [Vicia faba]|uniref:Uncharacterized protein n=1 Tax=Vicia faba TaxID=3906 RepID=A0AAV0YZ25_VICFA|nr:unnamed protein product [Vicia faba]